MTAIDRYLANLVDVVEGPAYTNDPADSGGPTKYGVTQATLARWRGHAVTVDDVEALTRVEALDIYRREYVDDPGFDKLAEVSEPIAIECIDTGVNCGPMQATIFLQRCLNVFNKRGQYASDLRVDGQCGPVTVNALRSVINARGRSAERELLVPLNCLQGAHYIAIAEASPKDEKWMWGWFEQRVQLIPENTS